MTTTYPEAFDEDAISLEEVMGAADRFVAFRTCSAIAFRLPREADSDVTLISKDEVLHLISEQLERGAQIEIAG